MTERELIERLELIELRLTYAEKFRDADDKHSKQLRPLQRKLESAERKRRRSADEQLDLTSKMVSELAKQIEILCESLETSVSVEVALRSLVHDLALHAGVPSERIEATYSALYSNCRSNLQKVRKTGKPASIIPIGDESRPKLFDTI